MVVSNTRSLRNKHLTSHQNNWQIPKSELTEFQTLVENTKVMMLIFQDDRICYANPISQVLTGYTKEELLVKTNFFSQLKLKPIIEFLELGDHDNCLASQEQQVQLLTKNGRFCWLDCSLEIVQFAGKAAILVTAVDVTKFKAAEQKSEQILQQEKKLVSMVSHELRSPLNVVTLSSNLLNRYCDRWEPDKIREYLERLQRGVDTLSLLIDEWLILGKVDSGKLKFEPQNLNLEQFCDNLLSDLQLEDDSSVTQQNRPQQQINFFYKGDCSSVSVDRRILQLILTNLLENALKYSPQTSEVDFLVFCNSKQVTFKIKDRGIGIAKSDLPQLFEPFYRGENVNNILGHGLGLAIVKKLIDIHGGQINIDSEVGAGTEFTITFPRLQVD